MFIYNIMVQGYCLKEKKKVEIKSPSYELNSIGRPVAKGTCPSCGGKVQKILKSTEVPADLRAKAEAFKARKSKKGGASRKSRKSSGSRKSRKSKGSRKSRGSRRSRK